MQDKIRDIMTNDPIKLEPTSSAVDAAKKMRDANVGAVLVEDEGKLLGIVTDRDIAVRVVALGKDPKSTTLDKICSSEIAVLSPDDRIDHAIELMRKKGIRRIPVQENGSAIGIVSLGDLAIARDPKSALGGISSAQANL